MAKSFIGNASIPVDTPVEIRPGVMHRESDFFAAAKRYALPPEAPERTQKGDLGFAGLGPPADVSPVGNLRKG